MFKDKLYSNNKNNSRRIRVIKMLQKD